jgi:hypothetical protein
MSDVNLPETATTRLVCTNRFTLELPYKVRVRHDTQSELICVFLWLRCTARARGHKVEERWFAMKQ